MDTPNISKWDHGKKKATSPNSLLRCLFISVFPEYHLSLVHSYTTRRTAYCKKALALLKSPRSRCSRPDRETMVHRAVSDPCKRYPKQAQSWAVLHEAACVVLRKPFGCRTDSSSSLRRRILQAAAPREHWFLLSHLYLTVQREDVLVGASVLFDCRNDD